MSDDAWKPIEIDPNGRPLLERIGRLRVLSWSTVMPDAAERSACWLDGFELAARHWCIFNGDEPVAAGRLSVHHRLESVPDAEIYSGVFDQPPPSPIASFNRLVVHPRYRGRGFSRKIDEIRLRAAQESGCQSVIGETHAGTSRVMQLQALGFRIVGQARSYPPNHFVSGSGVVFCRDLTASVPSIEPTSNRMGWSGDVINEISREFIKYAPMCRMPVLDVGSGYGVATLPALATGATVYANDLSSDHLAVLIERTPEEDRARLLTVAGRFPDDLSFPEESLGAIHASQILHFLLPHEVESGLRLAFRWLRKGGFFFALATTPYQATNFSFAPVFEERKAKGDLWPGLIEDLGKYNSHWSAELLPTWLHVFDDDVLSAAFRRAGFIVEYARMFSRSGLPEFCRLDGRENLGIVARKPGE